MQPVKKFPAFHGTRRFITALTSVHHLSLSWANPIQSIYPHPTSCRYILILSTYLRLGLPSGLLPSGFPIKTLYTPLSSPIRATCPQNRRKSKTSARFFFLFLIKSYSNSVLYITMFLMWPTPRLRPLQEIQQYDCHTHNHHSHSLPYSGVSSLAQVQKSRSLLSSPYTSFPNTVPNCLPWPPLIYHSTLSHTPPVPTL